MKIHILFFCFVAVFIAPLFSIGAQVLALENYTDNLTLSFYNADTPVHFIVVDKSTQKLMVFEQQQSLKLLKTYVCATGENPGTKIISGDSKTPEGLYFITEIYQDKKITVFGSRAFHLDYPNIFDKHAGHLGDGIFIHGTNKTLIPYSTNGCITLANEDLDDLATYLTINAVPIIVLKNLSVPLLETDLKISKDDTRFNEILDELSFHPGSLASDNVETLSFLTLGDQAIASIRYRVYDEYSSEYRYSKRAYLTAALSNGWRTLHLVQSQDIIPTLLALHPVKHQLLERLTTPESLDVQIVQMDEDEEVLAFVKKWQTAWAEKDINTYIDCYSPSFRNGRLDRKRWRAKKNYLNKKYDFIKVAIQDIAIIRTDTGANVSLFLEYQSDQYQTSGTKLLELINRDNKWMIQKEIM
ncbi:MAG: murein L,D-transpeptidase [Desulfobulbaceae bacterium]|nr:murein L,D-transpeptidase [Desulfobulbaceae bacterium]